MRLKTTFITIVLLFATTQTVLAASKAKIDRQVDKALQEFVEVVDGAQDLMDDAAGVLIFPKVTKAGLLVGGEAGDGALLVDGDTVDYYRTISA